MDGLTMVASVSEYDMATMSRLLIGLTRGEAISTQDRNIFALFRSAEATVRSRVVKKTRSPAWDEDLLLVVEDPSESLEVEVYHETIGGDRLLGTSSVRMDQLVTGRPKEFWLNLISEDMDPSEQRLARRGTLAAGMMKNVKEQPRLNVFLTAIGFGLDRTIEGTGQLASVRKLIIEVGKLTQIKSSAGKGTPECNIRAIVGRDYKITEKKKADNPEWKEVFVFPVSEEVNKARFEIIDRDKPFGVCEVLFESIVRDRSNPKVLTMDGAPTDCNKLHVVITPLGFGKEPDLVEEAKNKELAAIKRSSLKAVTGIKRAADKFKRKVKKEKSQLKLTVLEASGDIAKGADIEARVYIQFGNTTCQTEEDDDSDEPFWNENFTFDADTNDLLIYFELRDGQTPIGFVEYDTAELFKDNTADLKLPLQWTDSSKTGTVFLHVMMTPQGYGKLTAEQMKDEEDRQKKESDEISRLMAQAPSLRIREPSSPSKIGHRRSTVSSKYDGTLEVTITNGRDLLAANRDGTSDPFCVLWVGDKEKKGRVTHKTKVVKKNLNPTWNESFTFQVTDLRYEKLCIDCWDYDLLGRNNHMGYGELNLSTIVEGKQKARIITLNTKGLINITVTPTNFGLPPAKLTVRVEKAENLLPDSRKASFYIILNCDSGAEYTTETEENTLRPIFQQAFTFDNMDEPTLRNIKIQAMMVDSPKDTCVGEITIPVAALDFDVPLEVYLQTTHPDGVVDYTGGKVLFSCSEQDMLPFEKFPWLQNNQELALRSMRKRQERAEIERKTEEQNRVKQAALARQREQEAVINDEKFTREEIVNERERNVKILETQKMADYVQALQEQEKRILHEERTKREREEQTKREMARLATDEERSRRDLEQTFGKDMSDLLKLAESERIKTDRLYGKRINFTIRSCRGLRSLKIEDGTKLVMVSKIYPTNIVKSGLTSQQAVVNGEVQFGVSLTSSLGKSTSSASLSPAAVSPAHEFPTTPHRKRAGSIMSTQSDYTYAREAYAHSFQINQMEMGASIVMELKVEDESHPTIAVASVPLTLLTEGRNTWRVPLKSPIDERRAGELSLAVHPQGFGKPKQTIDVAILSASNTSCIPTYTPPSASGSPHHRATQGGIIAQCAIGEHHFSTPPAYGDAPYWEKAEWSTIVNPAIEGDYGNTIEFVIYRALKPLVLPANNLQLIGCGRAAVLLSELPENVDTVLKISMEHIGVSSSTISEPSVLRVRIRPKGFGIAPPATLSVNLIKSMWFPSAGLVNDTQLKVELALQGDEIYTPIHHLHLTRPKPSAAVAAVVPEITESSVCQWDSTLQLVVHNALLPIARQNLSVRVLSVTQQIIAETFVPLGSLMRERSRGLLALYKRGGGGLSPVIGLLNLSLQPTGFGADGRDSKGIDVLVRSLDGIRDSQWIGSGMSFYIKAGLADDFKRTEPVKATETALFNEQITMPVSDFWGEHGKVLLFEVYSCSTSSTRHNEADDTCVAYALVQMDSLCKGDNQIPIPLTLVQQAVLKRDGSRPLLTPNSVPILNVIISPRGFGKEPKWLDVTPVRLSTSDTKTEGLQYSVAFQVGVSSSKSEPQKVAKGEIEWTSTPYRLPIYEYAADETQCLDIRIFDSLKEVWRKASFPLHDVPQGDNEMWIPLHSAQSANTRKDKLDKLRVRLKPRGFGCSMQYLQLRLSATSKISCLNADYIMAKIFINGEQIQTSMLEVNFNEVWGEILIIPMYSFLLDNDKVQIEVVSYRKDVLATIVEATGGSEDRPTQLKQLTSPLPFTALGKTYFRLSRCRNQIPVEMCLTLHGAPQDSMGAMAGRTVAVGELTAQVTAVGFGKGVRTLKFGVVRGKISNPIYKRYWVELLCPTSLKVYEDVESAEREQSAHPLLGACTEVVSYSTSPAFPNHLVWNYSCEFHSPDVQTFDDMMTESNIILRSYGAGEDGEVVFLGSAVLPINHFYSKPRDLWLHMVDPSAYESEVVAVHTSQYQPASVRYVVEQDSWRKGLQLTQNVPKSPLHVHLNVTPVNSNITPSVIAIKLHRGRGLLWSQPGATSGQFMTAIVHLEHTETNTVYEKSVRSHPIHDTLPSACSCTWECRMSFETEHGDSDYTLKILLYAGTDKNPKQVFVGSASSTVSSVATVQAAAGMCWSPVYLEARKDFSIVTGEIGVTTQCIGHIDEQARQDAIHKFWNAKVEKPTVGIELQTCRFDFEATKVLADRNVAILVKGWMANADHHSEQQRAHQSKPKLEESQVVRVITIHPTLNTYNRPHAFCSKSCVFPTPLTPTFNSAFTLSHTCTEIDEVIVLELRDKSDVGQVIARGVIHMKQLPKDMTTSIRVPMSVYNAVECEWKGQCELIATVSTMGCGDEVLGGRLLRSHTKSAEIAAEEEKARAQVAAIEGEERLTMLKLRVEAYTSISLRLEHLKYSLSNLIEGEAAGRAQLTDVETSEWASLLQFVVVAVSRDAMATQKRQLMELREMQKGIALQQEIMWEVERSMRMQERGVVKDVKRKEKQTFVGDHSVILPPSDEYYYMVESQSARERLPEQAIAPRSPKIHRPYDHSPKTLRADADRLPSTLPRLPISPRAPDHSPRMDAFVRGKEPTPRWHADSLPSLPYSPTTSRPATQSSRRR